MLLNFLISIERRS